MTCKCASQIDELLKPKGEQLDIAFDMKGKTFYIVKITKIFGGRGKTTLMLAKFCPFCGVEQEKV